MRAIFLGAIFDGLLRQNPRPSLSNFRRASVGKFSWRDPRAPSSAGSKCLRIVTISLTSGHSSMDCSANLPSNYSARGSCQARPRLTKQEDPRPANLPRMGLAAAFKVAEARVVAAGVVLAMLLCMPVCHLYLCVDNDLLRKPCKLDPPEDTPEATNTLRVPGGLYSCTSLDS